MTTFRRRTRRLQWARWPDTTAARTSVPTRYRRRIDGPVNTAPCSPRPARGCAHSGSPAPGETGWFEPACREVRAVRTAVGICDVSTLGKIDVQGPDAAKFLDRLYANNSSLAVGRVRYGIMLREDGFVFDDGTAARLAEHRFLITTTTAHAVQVHQHMHLCHQALWPELDVQFVSVTDQWAQFAVAGPRSRELLQRVLDPRCDIGNAAFPFMAAGAVALRDGEPARLFRISFSGELAYEIAVPGHRGDALDPHAVRRGRRSRRRRHTVSRRSTSCAVEKGHCIGNELNGQTTAFDLGLGRMVSTQKDFVGSVMARASLLDPARPRLVGISTVDEVRSWPAACISFRSGRNAASARPGPRDVRLLLPDPRTMDRPRPADQRTRASWRES